MILGNKKRRLTTTEADEVAIQWSPDGGTIYYTLAERERNVVVLDFRRSLTNR